MEPLPAAAAAGAAAALTSRPRPRPLSSCMRHRCAPRGAAAAPRKGRPRPRCSSFSPLCPTARRIARCCAPRRAVRLRLLPLVPLPDSSLSIPVPTPVSSKQQPPLLASRPPRVRCRHARCSLQQHLTPRPALSPRRAPILHPGLRGRRLWRQARRGHHRERHHQVHAFWPEEGEEEMGVAEAGADGRGPPLGADLRSVPSGHVRGGEEGCSESRAAETVRGLARQSKGVVRRRYLFSAEIPAAATEVESGALRSTASEECCPVCVGVGARWVRQGARLGYRHPLQGRDTTQVGAVDHRRRRRRAPVLGGRPAGAVFGAARTACGLLGRLLQCLGGRRTRGGK